MENNGWITAKEYVDITYRKKNGVARIAFNRPEVRNAFRPKTVSELFEAFIDAREDQTIGVVLLSAEGPSPKDGVYSFCSGGDQRVRDKTGYRGEDGIHRLNILEVQRQIRFMNKAVIAQEGNPKDLYNFPKNKFVANFIGDANVVKAEIVNKQSNSYELKLAEMNIKIESDKDLKNSVSVALRPEKIRIDTTNNDNCISASINNASFVGSSYQYILNSKIGKLYVISGDTNNPFKVGEEVFLSLDEKDVKVLND